MTVSSSQSQHSMRARAHGFVLPLTLALIVTVAFLLSVMFEHINAQGARAAIFTSTSLDAFERHAVEQEVIYRALLEVRGRDNTTLEIGARRYTGAPPVADWPVNGEAFIWNDIYEASSPLAEPANGSAGGQYQVRIQDTSGLLDINFDNPAYLRQLADYMGISSIDRTTAVNRLSEQIRILKEARKSDQFVTTAFSKPVEICGLPIWQDAPLCTTPEQLSFRLTAREGNSLSVAAMPASLRAFFDRDLIDMTGSAAVSHWQEIARSLGFYSPFQTNAVSGHYVVDIYRLGDSYRTQFVLNLLYDLKGAPYSVDDRQIVVKSSEDDFALPE